MTGPVWLIAGHRPSSPGAVTPEGVSEHAWCSMLVRALSEELHAAGIPHVVDVRSDALGYEAAMRAIATRAKQAGASCLLEVHFNAEATKSAARTEVLFWGEYDPTGTGKGARSVRGESLAVILAGRIDAAVRPHNPTRSRPRTIAQDRSWSVAGVNAKGEPIPAGAPLYALSLPHCPAVIVESHFGATRADHAAADKALHSGELTGAIVAGLREWLGR